LRAPPSTAIGNALNLLIAQQLVVMSNRSRSRGRDHGADAASARRIGVLSGLWTHQTGGFYHDERFATLGDVVSHYDTVLGLHLTGTQKYDLVQFLKSL
jgi:hypothetical protein